MVVTMAGDIEGALHSAASISDQKQKIDQYKLLLSSIICTNNVANSKAFIDHSEWSVRFFFFSLVPFPALL